LCITLNNLLFAHRETKKKIIIIIIIKRKQFGKIFIFIWSYKYIINPIVLLGFTTMDCNGMELLKKIIDEGIWDTRMEKSGSWASTPRSLHDYDANDVHDIITLRRVYKSLSLNILSLEKIVCFLSAWDAN